MFGTSQIRSFHIRLERNSTMANRKKKDYVRQRVLGDVVSRIQLQPELIFVHERHVLFIIQSIYGGENPGARLFVFDERAETKIAARVFHKDKIQRSDSHEWRSLIEKIMEPATVFFYRRDHTTSGKAYHYIVLRSSSGQKPTALLTLTNCIKNRESDFTIRENDPLWRWDSKSFSSDGRYEETTIVTLTDNDHPLEIYREGIHNTDEPGKKLVRLDSEIHYPDLQESD